MTTPTNKPRSVRRWLDRLVRRIPIFCQTCDTLRFRHRYGMCRECWSECCRITWEAIWWDKVQSPNAPASATGSQEVKHEA